LLQILLLYLHVYEKMASFKPHIGWKGFSIPLSHILSF